MNRVVSNSIWIMAENILQMIISLFVGMMSARFLGPSDYGLISYGTAFVSIFGVIAKLGIDSIIVKEFVDRPNDIGKLIGTSVALRTLASGLSVLLILLFVEVLNGHKILLLTVTFLQSISICFQGIDVIAFWYQSKLKSKNVSIARSIAYLGIAMYKISLLILRKDVRWFAFSVTLEYIIQTFVLLMIYLRQGGPKWSISCRTAKRLLSAGFPFIWSGLISVLYTQMDKLMLGYFLGDKEIGIYTAAVTIVSLWGFLPGAVITSMNPVIIEEHNRDENAYQQKLILLFSIVLWMGIVICFGITLFSKLIILVLYGRKYVDADIALRVLTWGNIFAYLGTARGIFLINESLNKYSLVFTSIGGGVNLFLNYFFVQFLGMEGVAVATLITQIIVSVIAPLFFSKTRVLVKYYIKAISPRKLLYLIIREVRK